MLSVIIAAYDMQRELPRTLISAMAPAQRQVDSSEYEILVVDNGSPTPLRLDQALWYPGGPSITVVRIDPSSASHSPVSSINAAVREAAGETVLVCIDGARMLSSLLIRRTIDRLRKTPAAVTIAGSRHLGSKPQMQSVMEGYCQDAEDVLLNTVDWQGDLDQLFSISVWAGAHVNNCAFVQNESNAIGMTRSMWERIGGYNEGFSRPGGGLCNLELFDRIRRDRDAICVSLLGEATFHQVHGGAATSNASYFGDSLQEYAAVTGRPYEFAPDGIVYDLGHEHGRSLFARNVCCK
jgi:hypothetical protein